MMESQSGDLPPAPASPGPVDLPNGKRRWRRNRVACDSCHSRRVRCDRAFPCSRCLRSDIHCEFTRERRKRGRIARSKLVNGPPAASDSTPTYVPRKEAHGNLQANAQPALSPLQHSSPRSALNQRSPVTRDLSLSAPSVEGLHSAGDASRSRRTVPAENATEDWLSTAHLSPQSCDILGGVNGGDVPLPQLADIWNPVDLAGHAQRSRQVHPIPAQDPPGQGRQPGARSRLK